MSARAKPALFALLAFVATIAFAQEQEIHVDVASRNHRRLVVAPEDEILNELESVKSDALVLYTDYASRAGNDLKTFLTNITGFADDVIRSVKSEGDFNDTDNCWIKFEYHMKKIEHDARRAATYSGDSHHKFLLGHMIVFRMHLNKSDDYLKKSEKAVRGCGQTCESTPRVKRWRRLAMEEIHRVKDDIQHAKKSYRDLVSHARRKLNHLKKHAISKGKDAVEQYKYCKQG